MNIFATDLTQKQKFAVHFFDERGKSVLSQNFLHAENKRLEEENQRLKEALMRAYNRIKSKYD